MKLNTPSLKHYHVAIITLVVLAIIFIVYFFVYVPERQAYVHERAFRILTQNDKNLHEKNQTVITNARQEVSYRNTIEPDEPSYRKLLINSDGKVYNMRSIDSIGRVYLDTNKLVKSTREAYRNSITFTRKNLSLFPDILIPLKKKILAHVDKSYKEKVINIRDSLVNTFIASTRKAYEANPNDTTSKKAYNKLFVDDKTLPGHFNRQLVFTSIDKFKPVYYRNSRFDYTPDENWIAYTDTVHVVDLDSSTIRIKDILQMEFKIKLSSFVKDCLLGEGEVFDGYQLFTEKDLVYSTVPGELTAFAEDKLYGRDHITRSQTKIHDVEIAGVPYKLFTQKIDIVDIKEPVVLGGLITTKNYRAQVYEVSMFTILFSLLLMLVLVLGYPFLKLLIMNRHERLKSGDAFFCAFSVVVGSFMLVLIALSSYVYLVPEQKAYNANLKALSDTIQTTFVRELDSAYCQMEKYKSASAPKRTNTSDILKDSNAIWYPKTYPYFNDVFWTDAQGNIRESWNTRSSNQPYVMVADRAYFKRIVEKHNWNLNTTAKDSAKPFMLEPIFNRITGENLAVLSVPSDPLTEEYTYKFEDGLRPVQAMVVSLHSVINAVMPLGYGFCILDKEGKTWFHSDRKKNLQEQFLKECEEDPELLAALHGSASRHLDITYNGQQHLAYISPFEQLPLYLIVIHKEDYFKSIRTMTISTSIIYYLLALLPLCILLMVHKATFRQDFKIRGENFAFRWLTPRDKKVKEFLLLAMVLAGLIGFNIWMLFFHWNETDLWLFYVLTSITSFAVARSLLYDDSYLRPGKRYIFLGVYSLMVFLLFIKIAQQWESNPWYFIGVIILPILVTTGLIRLMYNIRSKILLWLPSFRNRKRNLKFIYPRTMFAWVVLLGIVPALAFYKINYNREQRIAAGHYLIELARDLTEKEIQTAQRYQNIRRADTTLVSSLVKNYGKYNWQGEAIAYTGDTPSNFNKEKRWSDLIPRFRLRPLYNKIVTENHLLLKSDILSGHWRWQIPYPYDLLQLHFSEYNFSIPQQPHPVLSTKLTSFNVSYLLPDQYWDTLFLAVGAVVIIIMFYRLIRYASIYLFNFIILEELNYSAANKTSPANRIINLEDIKGLIEQEQKRVFLSGSYLPDAKTFESLIDKTKAEVKVINLENYAEDKVWLAQYIKPGHDNEDKNNRENNSNTAIKKALLHTQVANGYSARSAYRQQAHFKTDTTPKTEPASRKVPEQKYKFIITHFEQLTDWALDEKYKDVTGKLYQLIDHADSVIIFSLKDLRDMKESIEETVETGLKKEDKENKNPDKKPWRAINSDNWENLLGNFQVKHFHLDTFSEVPDPSSHDNSTPGENNKETIFSAAHWKAMLEKLQKNWKTNLEKLPKNHKEILKKLWNNRKNYIGKLQKDWKSYIENLWNVPFENGFQSNWQHDLIDKECKGHGRFLENIISEMQTHCSKSKETTRGGIILRIQHLARFHYAVLWKSCTRDEQYVLYDLAQDGLVNSKNIQAITSLLAKGLVTYDGAIRIMNKSFRNYIITSIQFREGLIIEREIMAKGSWNEFQTALVLVIAAIIAFIFATQRETYDQIIAIITTFTASIPLLLRLVGSISFGGNKPAA